MGVVNSKLDHESDVGDAEYLLISSEPEGSLHFDPDQSYLLGYSINLQASKRFKQKQLSDTVVDDASRVISSFVEKGVLSREHATHFEAKLEPESCTFQGIKTHFIQQAVKVGEGGMFVFHFSGHGIKVGNSKFGLAPADFDYTAETYITAVLLSQWLEQANCRAKYVLFIIDCCYSGGLAEALVKDTKCLSRIDGMYVMASCTANEVSVIVGTLGNSIFCYFLSHVIHETNFQAGQFPIEDIHEKCKKLCSALSSLLLNYDKVAGVTWKTMQPELAHLSLSQTVFELQGKGEDQPDTAVMRFSYATELYDSNQPFPELDDKCKAWLEMTYTDKIGALVQLKEERFLSQERHLMDTVLCCMMRSVAAIQLACNPATVASNNLFITAFMHVVAAIDMVQNGVVYQEREFALGLGYYMDVLQIAKTNTRQLQTLFDQLLRNVQARLDSASREADMTDFGEKDNFLPRLPAITRNLPL